MTEGRPGLADLPGSRSAGAGPGPASPAARYLGEGKGVAGSPGPDSHLTLLSIEEEGFRAHPWPEALGLGDPGHSPEAFPVRMLRS